jgi:ATP-binding cassette subfamily B (MDR/TAP) protein 1
LLSGGQKQRIAIARAIIGQRPILLMDEATSALDNENAKVIESLMISSSNRTTIFISHKIQSAMQADQIVVLDKGRVVERGTHNDLMETNGVYKRLYDAQTSFEPLQKKVEVKPDLSVCSEKVSGDTFVSHQLLDTQTNMPVSSQRSFSSNLWEIAK